MSPEDANSGGQRERALARMLAEALDRQGGARDAAGPGCPGPDLVAAYADGGLDATEVSRWEEHFASCGRCRKILAVLTVSDDTPLTKEEVARMGRLVASVSGPARPEAEAPAAPKPPRAPLRSRWLAPAAAAAAALALWFVVRPLAPGGEPTVETAADFSTSPSAPGTSEAPAAAREEGGAGAPAPAESAQARPAERATESADRDTAQSAAPLPPQNSSGPEAESAQRAAAEPLPAARSRAARATTMAMAVAPQPAFASPDGSVLWRLGPGGRIERSRDGGETWQALASGVTGELTAGVAPSNQAAWIVGRAGIILRMTNGQDWQRVSSPGSFAAGAAPDWVAVEARDALRATVTSADGRRFATSDGGRTWTAQ